MTDSGDVTYRTWVLGARYRLLDWLQVTGTVPFRYINGKRVETSIDGEGNKVKDTARFEQTGFGDITAMGWLDLTYPFRERPSKEAEEEEAPEDYFAGIGDPVIYFGSGVKFENGRDDERDRDILRQDRSKAAATGEVSVSDGAIPAYSQLGTGTTDVIFSVFYQQRFWRFTPNGSVSYTYTGGRNSVDYEFSNRWSWAVGTKYCIFRGEDCSQLYIRSGFNGVYLTHDDKDHSEDTTQLGSQKVGRVDGTGGSYTYWDIGLGYDLGKKLSINASAMWPLTDHNRDSDNAFIRQFGVGLQYKF